MALNFHTQLLIDTQTQKSELIILDLNFVEISRFTYAAHQIILTPQVNIVVSSVSDATSIFQEVSRWFDSVTHYFDIAVLPRPDTLERVNADVNSVRFRLTLNNVLIQDVMWNDNTQLITFQPRPVVIFNGAEFIIFRKHLFNIITRSKLGI